MKSQADDATGTVFAEEVRTLIQRSPKLPSGVTGYARVLKTGKLLFVTEQDTRLAAAALRALATRPSLKRLHGAAVLRKSRSGFNQGESIEPLDLSVQAAHLSSLAPNDTLLFWFTTMAEDGLPRMLTAPEGSETQLLADAAAASADGEVAEGVITMSETGELSMYIEDPFPDVAQHVAAWVTTYLDGYPALFNLVGIHTFTIGADGAQVAIGSASWDGLIDWDTIAAGGE